MWVEKVIFPGKSPQNFDNMENLPKHVLLQICEYLLCEVMGTFTLICKRWHDVYHDLFLPNDEIVTLMYIHYHAKRGNFSIFKKLYDAVKTKSIADRKSELISMSASEEHYEIVNYLLLDLDPDTPSLKYLAKDLILKRCPVQTFDLLIKKEAFDICDLKNGFGDIFFLIRLDHTEYVEHLLESYTIPDAFIRKSFILAASICHYKIMKLLFVHSSKMLQELFIWEVMYNDYQRNICNELIELVQIPNVDIDKFNKIGKNFDNTVFVKMDERIMFRFRNKCYYIQDGEVKIVKSKKLRIL